MVPRTNSKPTGYHNAGGTGDRWMAEANPSEPIAASKLPTPSASMATQRECPICTGKGCEYCACARQVVPAPPVQEGKP